MRPTDAGLNMIDRCRPRLHYLAAEWSLVRRREHHAPPSWPSLAWFGGRQDHHVSVLTGQL